MVQRIHAILKRALWVWLVLVPLGLFAAENPASKPAADIDQLLSRGYELEQSGDWSRAVQLYEDAAKSLPNSLLLRDRLRHCEVRYGLSRRYHDVSFRSKMLAMPRGQALKLFDEVFRKIEESYVEPVEPAKLFRAGVDHLLIACEDDQFKTTNLNGAAPADITQFRDRLRQWKTTSVRDR